MRKITAVLLLTVFTWAFVSCKKDDVAPVGAQSNGTLLAGATNEQTTMGRKTLSNVTVTVDDGKGGTASANTTIQVVRPAPIVELNFEDVYFDFDRSTLRPDALRLLDDAVTKLQANPGKNLIIEGHTCNIGTAEYNLALGERRANAVRQYLIAQGLPADRIKTISYGKERPEVVGSDEGAWARNRVGITSLQ